MLLTCLQLPGISLPSSFSASTGLSYQQDLWGMQSLAAELRTQPVPDPKTLCSARRPQCRFSQAPLQAQKRSTGRADSHCAVPLQAGSQTSHFSEFDFELKAATKGRTARHNGPTGILKPLNITPQYQESHKPATSFTSYANLEQKQEFCLLFLQRALDSAAQRLE